MSGWIWLSGAILLEFCGTLAMRYSDGFRHWLPTVGVFVFYGLCFVLLTLALKSLDLGLAYAIWAGVGTALIAAAGVLLFHEPVNFSKVISLILIILGVVGLNLSGGHS